MVVATEFLRPLTVDDLDDFPNDGMRREIITGELVVTPAPTPADQLVVGRLFKALVNFVDERGLGLVVASPIDVHLSPYDVVEPDIIFVASGRESILAGKYVDSAPDLVVEVLSPSTRRTDLVRKRALYAQSGIVEYWIADPEKQTLTILRLIENGYMPVASRGDLIESTVLVGLNIDPSELFANIPR